MAAIWGTLKSIKSRLPLNGDWILVTGSPAVQPEGAEKERLLTAQEISAELGELGADEAVRLAYERVRDRESLVLNVADHVRDKAKALLGASSFIFAVVFGVITAFLPSLVGRPGPIIWLAMGVSVMMLVHFSRSLWLAVTAMARETLVVEAPEEILGIARQAHEREAYKALIIQIMTYSRQSHVHVNERVNRIILSLHSLLYGMTFSLLLVALGVLARSNDQLAQVDVVRRLVSIADTQVQLTTNIGDIERAAAQSQDSLGKAVTSDMGQELSILRSLTDEVVKLRVAMETAARRPVAQKPMRSPGSPTVPP